MALGSVLVSGRVSNPSGFCVTTSCGLGRSWCCSFSRNLISVWTWLGYSFILVSGLFVLCFGSAISHIGLVYLFGFANNNAQGCVCFVAKIQVWACVFPGLDRSETEMGICLSLLSCLC